MRLSPTSPLFPYTTLFRSVDQEIVHLLSPRAAGVSPFGLRLPGPLLTDGYDQPVRIDILGDPSGLVISVGQDRKSTRLNSSHTVISYAVFCLKKKRPITSS